ncbi:MAG: AraC family transcriptional regulator [Pseudomonadota bacterium]
MSVLWPEKFAPQETGQPTKLDLPGVSTRSALQIATVAPGVSVTKSSFLEAEGRTDTIKRQSDTVLIVFGLAGVMSLTCTSTGALARISESACWLIHPPAEGVERSISAGVATSGFVVSINCEDASPNLVEAADAFRRSGSTFAEIKTAPYGVADFETLFAEDLLGASLLQVEARCLAIVADVFSAYGRGDTDNISARVEAYLAPRIASKITLDDVARHVGMNRTRLNADLRGASGETVFEMLRRLRIAEARHLRDLGMPLAQIAAETGFSSASHMCRALKVAP